MGHNINHSCQAFKTTASMGHQASQHNRLLNTKRNGELWSTLTQSTLLPGPVWFLCHEGSCKKNIFASTTQKRTSLSPFKQLGCLLKTTKLSAECCFLDTAVNGSHLLSLTHHTSQPLNAKTISGKLPSLHVFKCPHNQRVQGLSLGLGV